MKLTRLVTIRSILARRLRSILTLGGIVLGVAGILAINVTNQNAYRSITRLFENTSGRVSLEIRSAANVGGLPEERLSEVAAAKGVALAVPILKLPAAIPGKTQTEIDLNFFGAGAGGLLLHGIDPEKDPDVRDYRITAGRFLEPDTTERAMVLVDDYARDQEIAVGDEVGILTGNGVEKLTVVGLIAKEGAGLTNLGKFGVLDLSLAQTLARREDEVDQIDLVADAGDSDPAFLAGLRTDLMARLGEGCAVVYPASQGDRMTQMLSGYQIGLNFMAGIALFVGAFLIYNAFSMTVAERTRELGLLRSVGMTRRQVTGQVILEGIMFGLAGAAFGAAFGIFMARGLTGLMARVLGQPLNAGAIPLDLLLSSMAVGIAVTLLAAFLPAWHAGRVSPLEALRVRGRREDGRLMRFGWIGGIALLAVSAAILVWNPFPYDVQFRLGSVTVFALFLGAMLVIPVTLRFWQALCRHPFRLIFGSVGEIGSRNLDRARKRTMLTCAALLVGVSMIVVTQGMTTSFTDDLYQWMDAYIGGDIYIGAAVPLTLDLKAELEALPGVDTAAPMRQIEVTWLRPDTGAAGSAGTAGTGITGSAGAAEKRIEEKLTYMAVEPESYTAVTRFIFTEPEVEAGAAIAGLKQGNTLFVSSVISEKYGLKPGDELTLRTRDSEQAFRVAAVVLDFFNQGLVVTGSWQDLERHFDVRDVTTYFVKTDAGADTDAVIRQIEDEFKDAHELIAESNAAIRERADGLLRQAFSMFDVLGIIAVMVAALGVLNTLSMSVVERTREIGMLRSMGMTRFQVVRMILAEAGLLGVIGGLLGLGFGLALTRIFLAAMGAMSGYSLDFVMPVRAVWLSLIVALATSQIAALMPAVRAARTPMLAAIHYE